MPYKIVKISDDLKYSETDTDHSDFIALWHPVLTYLSQKEDFVVQLYCLSMLLDNRII